jgi:hypothetical protein
VGDNRPHAHHALQLLIAPAKEVSASVAGHDMLANSRLPLDADLRHCVALGQAALLFIDRESDIGHAAARW